MSRKSFSTRDEIASCLNCQLPVDRCTGGSRAKSPECPFTAYSNTVVLRQDKCGRQLKAEAIDIGAISKAADRVLRQMGDRRAL